MGNKKPEAKIGLAVNLRKSINTIDNLAQNRWPK